MVFVSQTMRIPCPIPVLAGAFSSGLASAALVQHGSGLEMTATTFVYPPMALAVASLHVSEPAPIAPGVGVGGFLGNRVAGDIAERKSAMKRIFLDRARRFLSDGGLDQAVAAIGEVLAIDPGDPEAFLLRGVAEAKRGEHRLALEDFDRILKIDPSAVPVHQSRALSLQELGRNAEADAAYSRVIQLDPDFAEAYLKRGILRGMTGAPDAALEDFSRYIDLRPSDPLGYESRALALVKLGRHPDARPDMLRARALRGGR